MIGMKSLCVSFFVLCFSVAWSQQHTTYFCGQHAARERLFSSHPHERAACEEATRELEQFTREYESQRGGAEQIFIIPVVFHVIHENGNENISNEQINDAIAILTRDFRKLNPDTLDIVDAFTDIAADTRIEFRLATIDPDGNCHSGINRIVSPLTNDGTNSDMKALSYWPRNNYLNIWVCAEIGNGIAGFTNLPGDVSGNWGAFEDGIVMRSDYVGSIGTSSPIKSRTLTHEVGHWINLYHTWGPTNSPADPNNCDFDDNVTDTPNTVGYTSCNVDGASCGSLVDNVQNYMEYSYCSRMFTEGQATRMRAALQNNTAQRNQLWTTANLEETGVLNPPLCLVSFTSSQFTVCSGDTVAFYDNSYHNVVSWEWDFGDGQTLSGSDPLTHKNPTHTYAEPGVYNVSLTVSNGAQSLSTTENAFVRVLSAAMMSAPLEEGFEGDWPGNWITNNPNSDETWEITPNAFFSGSKSLRLRNYNIDAGNVDELYTATIDLTGATAASISYKWAWANRTSASDDRLRISASPDCGVTWSMRKLHKGLTNLPTATATNTFFVPAGPDDWSENTIDLINEQWFNDRFRVKFDFTGYGGNNLYLDDINITAQFPTGVQEAKPVFFFTIYPNPSDENMILDIYEQSGNRVHIGLYNSQGQLVNTLHDGLMAPGKHLFTLEHHPAGLYTVVMSKDSHSAIQRVVFR
jgi:PKD repeat protein